MMANIEGGQLCGARAGSGEVYLFLAPSFLPSHSFTFLHAPSHSFTFLHVPSFLRIPSRSFYSSHFFTFLRVHSFTFLHVPSFLHITVTTDYWLQTNVGGGGGGGSVSGNDRHRKEVDRPRLPRCGPPSSLGNEGKEGG